MTLKTWLGFVQGHWKWHHLIDRIEIPIYLSYGAILYRLGLGDIATYWWKIAKFLYPTCIYHPRRRNTVIISWRYLVLIKLEWLGYRMVKNYDNNVKQFSSDTGTSRTDRHRRTDGRTHNVRQTDLLCQIISVSRVRHNFQWHKLNSTSSCRHVHSVNNCHLSMNVVTQLTQFVGRDVINQKKRLTWLYAVQLGQLSWFELSCVAINGHLLAIMLKTSIEV